MASSDVAIANLALTKLGELRITDLEEDTKPAREINAVYAMLRDKLQRRYVWRFCVTRAELAAEVDTPEFGYSYQFPLPADCLRVLQVGEYYAGVVLNDAVAGGSQEYQIERGRVLSNSSAALKLRYLALVDDPTAFDPAFDEAFAAFLAYNVAEALAQSSGKKDDALRDYRMAIRDAVLANAIENPPEELADDTWVMARL